MEVSGHFKGLGTADAVVDVDWHGEDSVGGFLGNFFDVHAAVGGADQDWAVEGAIHEHGEVSFAFNVEGMGDHDLQNVKGDIFSEIHLFDFDTLWWSLFCVESIANHGLDQLADFLRVLGQVDTT